jgi:polyferredoxin
MNGQPLHFDLSAPGGRYELTRIAPLKRLVKSRGFQFALILPSLFGFVLVILTGLFGTRVGNANFSIIFVWIVWWAALIMLLIPLGARAWCAMCPIPAPGEWLQRRALIGKGIEKPLAFATKHWPKRFKNIWLQNAAFLGVALFSAIILTRPSATALVLLVFIGVAMALHLVYGKRVFCRYVCPVGGFVGLYAMVAPLEIRVKDPQVCRTHKEKECLRGSATAYGCPWLEYPGTMVRNTYCGMCTECLKACPKDNIGINLRPFGQDLLVADHRRLDEAYKAFIMLTCAGVYSAVMMGPWGWLKDWANLGSVPGFVVYATLFLAANLLVVPGLFYLAAWAGRRLAGLRRGGPALPPTEQLVVHFAYALVPMGLAAWIAFSLAFVLVNGSYAVPLLSDPFGWGWNLFGTAGYPWTPYVPEILPFLQAPVLLAGLAVAITYAHKIARQVIPGRAAAFRATLPVAVFLTGATLVFLRLYLG